MADSTPQFDDTRRAPAGRLVFTQDLNAALDRLVALMIARLAPSHDGSRSLAAQQVYVLKVTDEETGGAKYKCKVLAPFGNVSGQISYPASSLEDDMLEQGDEVDPNGLFIHLDEYGKGTHVLTDGSNEGSPYMLGLHIDYTADNRMVLVGLGLAYASCTTPASRPATYSATREISTDGDSVTVDDVLLYVTYAGSTTNLPDAATYGEGRELVFVNLSGSLVSIIAAGSDTTAGVGAGGGVVDIATDATCRIVAIPGGWLVTGNV